MAQKPQRVSPAESWLSPCGFADGPASQQLCKWKAESCWRSERAGKLATKRKKELQVAKWKCNGKINGTLRFAEWINWVFFSGSVFFLAKKKKKARQCFVGVKCDFVAEEMFKLWRGKCLLWLLGIKSPLDKLRRARFLSHLGIKSWVRKQQVGESHLMLKTHQHLSSGGGGGGSGLCGCFTVFRAPASLNLKWPVLTLMIKIIRHCLNAKSANHQALHINKRSNKLI